MFTAGVALVASAACVASISGQISTVRRGQGGIRMVAFLAGLMLLSCTPATADELVADRALANEFHARTNQLIMTRVCDVMAVRKPWRPAPCLTLDIKRERALAHSV